ncbi:MAG: Asp-tRNA(Asn)/Glu-tRNA(Gln) amidotransferase subunit GatB [Bacteroidetes bacterium]|nr:Asp-tRNA(Asn)/Glu-tRNA(Gln) amidotransferase subunit GatB [Bacteroidota bacterium]
MDYEPVIGLEVHAQLLTSSKMFCTCSADYAGAPPNTHVCPVCLGMPGVLPVANRKAIEYTVMTALALNCQIPEFSKFDRKNYPYPDLVKGYQISQYDMPLSHDGWMTVELDGETTRIGIIRVHLEEDTSKLTHVTDESGGSYSLVDVNRSGVPLMEIVSAPDIHTPAEARAYLIKLRAILQALGVSTGNMEEGSFRCDANVSLRPAGSDKLGTKTEVKNMNSFRSVQRALEYEIKRQTAALEQGDRIVQETRGWVDDKGITVSQRSKEFAHDYRYFPEPDLPPLVLSREWVEGIRARLAELPDARRERFIEQFGLSRYDAIQLTASRPTAEFFEKAVSLYPQPKAVANWMQSELFRLLKDSEGDVSGTKVTPETLTELLELMDKGTINARTGKEVFEEMFSTGKGAAEIVKERGLIQISDTSHLEVVVDDVIKNSPQAVADYHAGKANAMGFLVGQVMKLTRGQANPGIVNQILRDKLG